MLMNEESWQVCEVNLQCNSATHTIKIGIWSHLWVLTDLIFLLHFWSLLLSSFCCSILTSLGSKFWKAQRLRFWRLSLFYLYYSFWPPHPFLQLSVSKISWQSLSTLLWGGTEQGCGYQEASSSVGPQGHPEVGQLRCKWACSACMLVDLTVNRRAVSKQNPSFWIS